MPTTTLSVAIAAGREAIGLTRITLAMKLSEHEPTSYFTVNSWEKGERIPNPRHLHALRVVLGWSQRRYNELVREAERARVNGAGAA